MKKLLWFLLFGLFCQHIFADSEKNLRVFVFDLQEEIAPPAWRLTLKAIEDAGSQHADIIILHLNTYGGLVDAADSIRNKLLHAPAPVYVLIENNAASAGALISIACDSIYMMPGSTIGAATVVTQDGTPAPDKFQSYMRATMRTTAEERGRNPRIAEAMVDPDIYIPGVVDSGKVLTFTASEAIANNYCEAEAANIKEALAHAGITNYELIRFEPSVLDLIINFLINPVVSSILIMLMIGGIYYELQSPGVGFPLGVSVVGAVLYFAPLYLEGLAEYWELAIFITGVILLLIELLVIPGFGITGILGVLLMVCGMALSMIGNVGFSLPTFHMDEVVQAFFTVVISGFISIVSSIWLVSHFVGHRQTSVIALNKEQHREDGYISVNMAYANLTGMTGTAYTDLRPAGKVKIDDKAYDAVAQAGYIEKNSTIQVVRFENAQLVVKQLSE